jgi:hypothetical protein
VGALLSGFKLSGATTDYPGTLCSDVQQRGESGQMQKSRPEAAFLLTTGNLPVLVQATLLARGVAVNTVWIRRGSTAATAAAMRPNLKAFLSIVFMVCHSLYR